MLFRSHTFTGDSNDAAEYIDNLSDRIAVVHVSAYSNGRMHSRPKGNEKVADILTHLADSGYSGPLILEIEDLTFQKKLSLKEKIEVVSEETTWVRNFFQ